MHELRDRDSILEIEKASIDHLTPLSLLSRYYGITPSGFLVAEIDGLVVGYVVGIIGTIRWKGEGYILAIAVDPSYRKKGIGTVLMTNIINRLKSRGAKRVYLEVKASNSAAQYFYSKLGFKEIGVEKGHYPDGEDALVMRRLPGE
ncbi:MAG: ribosomal protein S18-alanine N-acetyltransferase [Euryarchaeota archaeon]|nr:ribosomal protein S18-alanine N-acetyltransferase [Euryarchaeota archaeon]